MTKTPAILSHANVNAVLWITSLHENEQGVTRRILDDLEPYLASKEVIFQRFEPQGADHLMAYLDAVADAALAAGLAPIIHFDTHGTIEHGIHIVASKEDCLWDKITERLRAINVATGNDLCVVSLACFSFHIVRHLTGWCLQSSAPG